jgi:uncharacterized oxidoreductase
MNTTGRSVLITGGATGIGFELARELLHAGNHVAICGRRRSALLAAKRKLPGLGIRVCDVTRAAARRALQVWLRREVPRLDVLVNNAGIQRAVEFRKGTRDLPLAEQEIRTNLLAPIQLSAMLIPILLRRDSAAIVNISSGLGFTPIAEVPVYSATKAAIHSLSLTLRHQLRDTRIRVFEIAPPIVPTALSGRRSRPDSSEHTMSTEAVARGIVKALAEDQFEVALGPAANLHQQRDRLFEAINR